MSDAQRARILIVDDDRIILESLAEFLRLEGYEVITAGRVDEAMRANDSDPVELIICDVNMPGGNGFELLHQVRKRHAETALIMMTGYGTIESAVEAIKMGAFDYLTKPIDDDELTLCVQRALTQQAILRENRVLKDRLEERYGLGNIIGHDYRMTKVFELIESVSASRVTVLIQGDSGTGKSLVARAIHQLSDRCEQAFVEVACGAIPETLLESELFGHVRGAFTGAIASKAGKFKAASGGTIFLDEIATASPALQVKLLRVLQSQQFEPLGSNKTETVDVRVILAANVDMEEEVSAGRFREDLYYRINVVSIDVPTLAERISDVPLLARSFLKRFTQEANSEIVDFEDDAMYLLQRYNWPGNVRELENAIERAVVLCKTRRIASDDLPPKLRQAAIAPEFTPTGQPKTLKEALQEPERLIIEAALKANFWNRQLTAEQLGINRTTLYKKIKHHGLEDASAGFSEHPAQAR